MGSGVLLLASCRRKPKAKAAAEELEAETQTPAAVPESTYVAGPLPEPDAQVLALLDGLRSGDSLGPVRVTKISGVVGGRVLVRVALDAGEGWLAVTLFSESPLPPASTKKYSVFFVSGAPERNRLDNEVLGKACGALAERIARVEASVPVPPELTR
ncbi:MAG TPA: hypothetical protein VGK73_29835 [Polyangiaceae bacterium]